MCWFRFFFILLYTLLFFIAFTTVDGQLEEYCPLNDGETPKECLLRQWMFDQHIWNYFAGFFCYNYTNDLRLNFKYNYSNYPILCRNSSTSIPFAIVDQNTYAFFDYTNTTSMNYIRKSFRSDYLFSNFLTCCEEATQCCENEMNDENILTNSTHCPAIWDAWSCFPPTKVNTTARRPCSSQAYQSPEHVCRLESEKDCNWNNDFNVALWEQQTDYSVCAIAPVYKKRHEFHVVFLAVCIVLCLPAIIIFFLFEKLRRTVRVVLHRNLLIAICIRNIFTIMSKQIVILDALKPGSQSNNVLENNDVMCRVLAFFECSAKNCIYAAMLVDGFYLHKVIVRAFSNDIKICYLYITVIVLTFLPSLIWATAMGVNDGQHCWMVDSDGLQWIVDGFRIAILTINTILLLDIVRVMLMKMKHGSGTRQTKAAFRATLFLIPLFGIHIVFTANKIVYDDSCRAEDIYDYARYSLEALQGIFVAVLFCYANTEVHNEINNGYRKLSIYLDQKFGWNIRRDTHYRRRTTTATYVQSGTDC